MAKRPVPLYDFAAFGQAIKAARTERKESRKAVSDAMNISPRYLTNIENKGQQPSLQIFYELVTRYNISVDQFFFPNKGLRIAAFFLCVLWQNRVLRCSRYQRIKLS